jgi:hypothetical protein
MKVNKFNGKGKYYDAKGQLVKTGVWIEGTYQTDNIGCISGNCVDGSGTYIWETGQKYKGQWKTGKKNGKGTLFYENGTIYHKGLWKDDNPVKK